MRKYRDKKRGCSSTVVLPSASASSSASVSGIQEEGIGGKEKPNPEHRACSLLLKTRIQERRQAKIDERRLSTWDRDVRLMVAQDGRTLDQITAIIHECHDMPPTASGFSWRDQILSMETLREKWNDGKISIGMNRGEPKKSTIDGEAVMRQLEEAERNGRR